ncbi:MAG: response regulator transcription factor [Candidatus Kapaibacteriota bacterium]|jgi:two-component system chemotaxis response regulator CheY
MKILILEDDRHLLDLLTRNMQMYGECYSTDNGADALRAFEEAMINNAPFDIALLDVMLPGMSGYEVLEYIRQMEAQWKKDGLRGAKIIMVTALNSSKNIIQAFRENCEGYLTKPYTTEELNTLLKGLGIVPQREYSSTYHNLNARSHSL